MRRILVIISLALALSAGVASPASAHKLTADPSANGHGQGQGVTDQAAGGGPAHCKAAAPAKESSPVASFDPPEPICP